MPVRNNLMNSTALTGSPRKKTISRIAKSAVINPVWTVKRIIFTNTVSEEYMYIKKRADLLYLSYRHLEQSPTSAEPGQHDLTGDWHVKLLNLLTRKNTSEPVRATSAAAEATSHVSAGQRRVSSNCVCWLICTILMPSHRPPAVSNQWSGFKKGFIYHKLTKRDYSENANR